MRQEMSMKRFVSALLAVLLFAGHTALANAQPDRGERLHDTVNFWEQSTVHTE
jgi:hypothetical protein